MAKDSFILYKSFYEPIKVLSDEQLGRLFRALYAYQCGEQVEVGADISMAYGFFVNQFRVDEGKYERKVENIRNNASGRRNNSTRIESNRTELNQIGGVNVNDNVNENENVNENVSLCVESAREGACADTNTNKIIYILFSRNIRNAEAETRRFCAFYQAKGWKFDGKPMTQAQREAKAEMWEPKDKAARFEPVLLAAWIKALRYIPQELKSDALSDDLRILRNAKGDEAFIKCSKALHDCLMSQEVLPKVKPILINKTTKLTNVVVQYVTE